MTWFDLQIDPIYSSNYFSISHVLFWLKIRRTTVKFRTYYLLENLVSEFRIFIELFFGWSTILIFWPYDNKQYRRRVPAQRLENVFKSVAVVPLNSAPSSVWRDFFISIRQFSPRMLEIIRYYSFSLMFGNVYLCLYSY